MCSQLTRSLCVLVAVDSVLKRMTIIGVILSFRSLAQEALRDVSYAQTNPDVLSITLKCPHAFVLFFQVLSCHIPFLVSSVEDFKDHIPRETDMKVESPTDAETHLLHLHLPLPTCYLKYLFVSLMHFSKVLQSSALSVRLCRYFVIFFIEVTILSACRWP